MRPLLAQAAVVGALAFAAASPALAATGSGGGASPPGTLGAPGPQPVIAPGPSGGAAPGTLGGPAQPAPRPRPAPRPKPKPAPRPKSKPRPRPHHVAPGGPLLTSFSITPANAFAYGRPATVSFELRGGPRLVHLALLLKRAGGNAVLRRIDLGRRPTGVPRTYSLAGAPLPEGSFDVRLSARGLRSATKASATGSFSFHWHCFPLAGNFTYGTSPDGRFGAARPGHTHQGQDIPAPTGTPVLAPRGGVVETVAYQKAGAGNYIVIHGAGENFDYVFMHLRDGSVTVQQGDTVVTGQQIAQVGSTGESTGPHLHFEIWRGPWAAGGQPIDPLPYLRRWDSWS